ncbi:MAG: 50S ribosomal protein L6 [Acidobacteria bacterium]|nr:MAG: 50S ribosomal protein L6 [Acidobacteriota bacterium]
MSRVGNKPIEVPAGVTVTTEPSGVTVKGPKGAMRIVLPEGIVLERKDGRLLATRESDLFRSLHGMARSLVANAVQGVTKGFEKHLDIVGVGYRAEIKGRAAVFTLGFSRPIEYPIPEGIQIVVDKLTHVVVSGADRQQVGQVAAEIRGLRPPDPYKNKGVRYTGERLKKKVGKAAAAAAGGAAPAKG